MPLYVVRWPNLSAALVRARNEDYLIDILDEIANPDGCTWDVYRGPLFLDLELPARIDVQPDDSGDDADDADGDHRPLDPARIRIRGVGQMASGEQPFFTIHSAGETGAEMDRVIAEFAFPATARVYWGEDSDDIDQEELERALKDDAMRLVEYTWRRSQLHRSDDPDARLALMMDASLRWVKQAGQRTVANDENDAHENGDAMNDDDSTVEEDITYLLDMTREDWHETMDVHELRHSLRELLDILDDWDDAADSDADAD